MKCNHDCFHCELSDCPLDEDDLTPEEIAMSEWLDNIAEKENEVDSSAVIRTGKRGRPKKLFPKYESEAYKKARLQKAKDYYHKHKAERIQYQKEYINNNYGKVRAYQNERYQRLKELYGNEYFNALNRKQYHRQRQNESAV